MDRPKIDVRSQRVVVEYINGEWWLMLNDGSIEVFGTPEQALRRVQRAAAKGNKGATVTRIEWRNAPDGFTPPKGQA
jgi:hypothetical protein